MGSGSGLVGLTAAALGGHVLLTDVPTVAENSLQPNIDANARDAKVPAEAWPMGRAASSR